MLYHVLLRTSLLWTVLLIAAFPATASAAVSVYPDDAYSRPADDPWHCFETMCGVVLAGTATQRSAEFHHNELLSVVGPGGRETEWRFQRKRGVVAAPNLGFFENLRRAPARITFHVRNDSKAPLGFTAFLQEVSWNRDDEKRYAQWMLPSQDTVAPGADQEVAFAMSEATGDKSAAGRTAWFPARLTIIVSAMEDEVDYTLRLSRLTLHYADAPGVTAAAIACPESIETPEVSFGIQASGIAAADCLDLEVRDEPWVLWRIRLTRPERESLAGTGTARVTRPVPWHLPRQPLTAGLMVNGYRAAGPAPRLTLHTPAGTGFPKTERREHNGRPTFFVDGKPLLWSGYASYDFQPGNVNEFGASGADMFVVATDAGRHVHQIAAPTWRDWERCDFGELNERVAMGLQANPAAYITLRVSLALPPFWIQEHPEGRAIVNGGPWEETGSTALSITSEAWREQEAACLRKLIEHCKAQPWAKRVVSIILGGEVTEEWFQWGCNDGQFADYSAANAEAYAAWRREKGLAPSPIPLPEERKRPGYDLYPPDDAGRNSAAYAQFLSDSTADTIGYFARVVKEATEARCLTGAFYGYVVQLAGEPRQHLSGHFALRRLLDNPDIDCLLGIPLHNFRRLRDGYDLYTSATESIFLHGKGYVNENDLFSWLHNGPWHTAYNPDNPRAGALRMHQRVLADDMVHGASRQWFSLLASWHHDGELQQEFAREIALNGTASRLDRASRDEVAFVIDDSSFAWMPPESTLPRVTHADLLYALGRTGAPVGVWLLSDLDRLPERIRVVVIADATAAAPQDLAKLNAFIERGGRCILIIGPAGLVNPATQEWNCSATRQLTGLPVAVEDAAASGAATLSASGTAVSNIASLRPRAYMEGPGWLRYSDGKTAGGERPLAHGGRLIWSGVPPLDSALLRTWIEGAGVHCYAPTGCFVHASKQLVAVTASFAGDIPIRWPGRETAEDCFTGWRAEGLEMICPFEAGQTRLFRLH